MADERHLPISQETRAFSVRVDGEEVPRTEQLLACSVVMQARHIAWARLVWLDGDAAQGEFPLASGSRFVPGASVEILAGAPGEAALLFRGLVLSQSLRLREGVAPQLIVECRDAALRLALAPRSAVYEDQTDADILRTLLGACGTPLEVADTAVRHEQLVQSQCTDWDFALARARANGLLVLPRAGSIRVAAPDDGAEPVLTLRHGATLLELDLQIDARQQPAAVRVDHWSAADQALQSADAAEPPFSGPGNLAPAELAAVHGVPAQVLRHTTLATDEAQALGDALWREARLDKLGGRALCEGLGTVQPGDVVTLAGTGARSAGRVLVTGVRHEMDSSRGWRTHLQFGGLAEDHALDQRLSAAPRPALLASVHGLQLGVVTALEDPSGEQRVRVRLPLVDSAADGVWARVAGPAAGDGHGFLFRPELGDEVVLGFLDDDPRHPVLLGALHSSARATPEAPQDSNPHKLYRSREGLELRFDDEQKVLTLSTPAGRTLVLDDAAGAIRLADAAGNELRLDDQGITLHSAAATTLETSTSLTQDVTGNFTLSVSGQLTLEGTAGAELRSAAICKLTGSLLQLN